MLFLSGILNNSFQKLYKAILTVVIFLLTIHNLVGQDSYTIFMMDEPTLEATDLRFIDPGLLGPARIKIKTPGKQTIEAKRIDYVIANEDGYEFVMIPINYRGQLFWGEGVYETNGVQTFEISVMSGGAPSVGPNGTMIGGAPNQTTVRFYRIDDSPIKLLNKENLTTDLSSNPKALEHLEKNKGIKAAKVGLYLVGGAMVLAGILNMTNETGPGNGTPEEGVSVPPLVILGGIFFVIPSLINMSTEDNLMQALETFAQER